MEPCDAIISVMVAYMVAAPAIALSGRPIARFCYHALERLGLHQSWQAFTGSRLDYTRVNWLCFQYADGSRRDDISGLDSLPEPHRGYLHFWMTADDERRDAVMNAAIEYVRIPHGGPAPTSVSLMEKVRLVKPSAGGPIIQERIAELASVELEVE